MVIHGEGKEGGVLPVIASQRRRRGGGPEVTAAFTRDKGNERGGMDGRTRGEGRHEVCEESTALIELQHFIATSKYA